MVLHLNVTCTGIEPPDAANPGSCEGGQNFAGDHAVPPVSADVNSAGADQNAASAVYLTDPNGHQNYVVVRDTAGRPLTTDVPGSWRINDTYPLWLYFPAPPSAARSLTVNLPGDTAEIANVPITS